MAFTGQNEKGSVLTSMLLIFPLLAAVIFAGISLRHLLSVSAMTKQICRESSLSSQALARSTMQKLFSLNSRAISLEKKYKSAIIKRLAAISSGNTVALAAAEAKILFIQGQKAALTIKQEQIKAVHTSRQKHKQFQTLTQIEKTWGNRSLRLIVSNKDQNLTPLAVERSANHSAPPYRTQSPLIQKQQNYYRWIIQLDIKLPYLKEKKWRFEQSCFATLKSPTEKPVLKVDSAY